MSIIPKTYWLKRGSGQWRMVTADEFKKAEQEFGLDKKFGLDLSGPGPTTNGFAIGKDVSACVVKDVYDIPAYQDDRELYLLIKNIYAKKLRSVA